jgi:hypothetical protein
MTASVFLCGCPNPNLYTTPRTLNPGDLQVQIAAEGIGASFNQTTTTPNANGTGSTSQTTTASFALPMVPTAGIRYGLVDGFELGARVANFDTLAADGKIRLLKGTLDLAVDPGLQFIYLGGVSSTDSNGQTTSASAGIVYLHVPLLVGFNVSPTVSLIATPGFVYAALFGSVSSGASQTQQAALSSGVMGRLGLGVNIRTSKKLSLQPEITFMKAFQNNDALLYIFGLGFNIGAQPDYSDLGGGGEAAPGAPPAPAPPAPPQ